MSEYSPFSVEFQQLKPQNLSALYSVAEGWYVEYKREVPSSAVIAKSVSAFANTYGGWIFYGVDELSKENAVAGAFHGIPVNDLDASLQKLRQAVASHLHPAPHFDVKVLLGPCIEIELAADRAVLCVYVPYSRTTPHLHKSGVIYRRVGDGSEPRPETDRFALDQLWRRGRELEEFYERWVTSEPDFSKGEAEAPYVRVLIATDLNRDRDAWLDASVDEVREIMKGDATGIELPFSTVHTTSDGFIARQVDKNDPRRLGLTWWIRRDLRSEVIFPLTQYDLSNLIEQQDFGYLHAASFGRLLFDSKMTGCPILDLNLLYLILAGYIKTKQKIADRAGWSGALWFKIQLLNVWRTVPFIDSELFTVNAERYGIPICAQSQVQITPGAAPGTFIKLPDLTDEPSAQQFIRSAVMLDFISTALGLPSSLDLGDSWFSELYQAGERARRAQELRVQGAAQH